MANYKLEFKRSVLEDLELIPKADVQKIIQRIDSLCDDPHPAGSIRLSGREDYRIRQGNYRILYQIIDHLLVITVIKVGHRRDVYK